MVTIKAGDIITFTYSSSEEGRFKHVFVLHPNWQGKLHGIDLGRLTIAERAVLNAIMTPGVHTKPHRIPLVNDIRQRMDPVEEIKNPMSFYSKFVKVFLRRKDAYRTYYTVKMANTVVVKNSDVQGKVINPKPLFKTIEPKALEAVKQANAQKKKQPRGPGASKPSAASKPAAAAEPSVPSAPSRPPSRIELMKQRMAALKKNKET